MTTSVKRPGVGETELGQGRWPVLGVLDDAVERDVGRVDDLAHAIYFGRLPTCNVAIEQAAVAIPGVVLVEHLAGSTHYQLRVAVATTEGVDQVIRQLKEELRVHSTNTKIVTRAIRAD